MTREEELVAGDVYSGATGTPRQSRQETQGNADCADAFRGQCQGTGGGDGCVVGSMDHLCRGCGT